MVKVIGQRVKEIRAYRKMSGKELALRAGISPAELSHIESGNRSPGFDITERLAGALEVTLDYLAGKEDADIPLERALARQSLRIFRREAHLSLQQEQYVHHIVEMESAPRTVEGWADLISNIVLWVATQK